MTDNKYLLVDIGDSGILYMVVTGDPIQSINKLARDVKTGSALQIGNGESNYIFHRKEIISKIQEKCEEMDVDTVCINLPAQYNNLALVPGVIKNKASLLSEIIKTDPAFDKENIVLVHGPLKRTDTGNTVTAVSAVNKEYFDIVKAISEEEDITVNVTTSFTRLQLLADSKVDEELVDDNFIIMDAGYTGTRIMLFDESATPTGIINSTLSGRDIINLMEGTDSLMNDNKFTARQDLSDGVKSYVNTNALMVVKQIKAKTGGKPCKIYVYGGLSTLPWKKACKEYDVETMICEYLEEKNKPIAIKVALMMDTPFKTCSTLFKVEGKNGNKKTAKSKSNVVTLEDETSEEDYVKQVKASEASQPKKAKKKVQEPEEEFEEEDEEEVKPKKKKSSKPKKADKVKKDKAKEEDEEDDDYEEDEVKPKKKKSSNPKKEKAKSKRKKVEEEYDDEDEEEYDYTRKFAPRTAILLAVTAIMICFACFITVGVVISHNTETKQNEVLITNERASLTAYVQRVIEGRGVKVTSTRSEVIGDKEFLYIGISDIQQDVLNTLLQTLDIDCDVVQNDIVYGAENTVSLTLSISFK